MFTYQQLEREPNSAMCYSAQIEAAYHKLVRMTGATVSLQEIAALYTHDSGNKRPKTPKAMDDVFRAGAAPTELAVWAEVEQWNRADPADLPALYRIFDDKRHPFYEHRLAA